MLLQYKKSGLYPKRQTEVKPGGSHWKACHLARRSRLVRHYKPRDGPLTGGKIYMVITLDKNKRPLGHCTPRKARKLIEKGRACVYRYYPFIIIIKDKDVREMDIRHNYRIKLDPGAEHTGLTVVEDDRVIFYMQIEHRGSQVVKNLMTRKNSRRNRRTRETWHRHPKWRKRGKYQTAREKGWLPPSQESILHNITHWVERFQKWLGPCDVSIEFNKFDPQLMENNKIEGLDYQHGELQGYEMKAYLLEKYQHTCQYCAGASEDKVLEWEHILPKTRGGSDRLKNATLACRTCNQKKDDLTPEEWLDKLTAKKRHTKLEEEQIKCLKRFLEGKQNGQNLRYAAWCNAMRWRLKESIEGMEGTLSLELASGGRTAKNRHDLGYKKDHHIDALCVGKHIPEKGFRYANQPCLMVKAMGRGTRLLGQINQCGIIYNKYEDRYKVVNGVQTGDIVHVKVPNGKYTGEYTGRAKIRRSGSHDVRCMDGRLIGATKKSTFQVLQHIDGYSYAWNNIKVDKIPEDVNGPIPLGN